MKKGFWRWVVIAISISMLLAGCSIVNQAGWIKELDSIDRAAKLLEEYGTASMSSPLLSKPDDAFKFDLHQGAEKYFNDAKKDVQGMSASFEQVSQGFSLGVAANLDPTVMADYASKLRQFSADRARIDQKQSLIDSAAKIDYLAAIQTASAESDPVKRATAMAAAERAYSEKLSPPSAANPAFPVMSSSRNSNLSTTNSLARQPTDATNMLAANKFKDFQGLISGLNPSTTPTISNRSAISTAAGDKAVESIFNILGKPQEAQMFKDKTVLFGVMMVSVEPGWRTQRKFAVDLSVLSSFEYQPARREVIEAMLLDSHIDSGIREKIARDNNIKLPKEIAELIQSCKDIKEDNKDLAKYKSAFDIDNAEYSKSLNKTKEIQAEYDDAIKKQKTKPKNTQLSNLVDELRLEYNRAKIAFGNTSTSYSNSRTAYVRARANESLYVYCRKNGFGTYSSGTPLPNWLNYSSARVTDPNRKPAPLVAAVSPMTETENLDLASSLRRQDSLALSLSFALRYAGLGGQANIFEEFVKSRQSDVHTRTATATVNSYSYSGGMFGFQIGPKLKALADTSAKDADAANTLERQSFPVLVLFATNKERLRPRIENQNDKFKVYEPSLTLSQQTQWLPLEWLWQHNWYKLNKWLPTRLSDKDKFQLKEDLTKLRIRTIDSLKNDAAQPIEDATKDMIRERIIMLDNQIFGTTAITKIPVEILVPDAAVPKIIAVPQLDKLTPDSLKLIKNNGVVAKQTVKFVMTGTNMKAVDLTIAPKVISGAAMVINTVRLGEVIVMTAEVADDKGPIIFQLNIDAKESGLDNPATVLTLPVAVSVEEGKANVVKTKTQTMKKAP